MYLQLASRLSIAALFVAAPVTFSSSALILDWSSALAQNIQLAAQRSHSPTVSSSIGIDLFYSELEPQGAWVRSPQYNYIWVPTQVSEDWSPYTNGRWIYLEDYGWYFESNEPFAWIVYHYGRWDRNDQFGWYWVPGTQWAPAWVSWRRDNNTVGWAPLSPQGNGLQIRFVIGREAPRDRWTFVSSNQFLAPQLSLVVRFGDQSPDLWRNTRPVGAVIQQNNIVVNNAIQINYIQQSTGQQIQPRKVQAVDDPNLARQVSGQTTTAIPVFTAPANIKPQAKPTQTIAPAEVQVVKKNERPAVVPQAGVPTDPKAPGAPVVAPVGSDVVSPVDPKAPVLSAPVPSALTPPVVGSPDSVKTPEPPVSTIPSTKGNGTAPDCIPGQPNCPLPLKKSGDAMPNGKVPQNKAGSTPVVPENPAKKDALPVGASAPAKNDNPPKANPEPAADTPCVVGEPNCPLPEKKTSVSPKSKQASPVGSAGNAQPLVGAKPAQNIAPKVSGKAKVKDPISEECTELRRARKECE